MLLVLLTNSRDLQRVEPINDIESPNLEWKDAAADLKKWGEKMIASLVSKRERLINRVSKSSAAIACFYSTNLAYPERRPN